MCQFIGQETSIPSKLTHDIW